MAARQGPPDTLKQSEMDTPMALAELMMCYQNLQQITDYCKHSIHLEDPSEEEAKLVRDHTHHALLNSAYHVHNVGAHLTNYLGLQAEEIDKLDTQVKVAQARLLLSKDLASMNDKPLDDSHLEYKPGVMKEMLVGDEVKQDAVIAAAPGSVGREKLQMDRLADVGITFD